MLSAVILAAGDSKRMKSSISKVLHNICGLPVVCHIVKAIQNAGIKKIVLVVSNNSNQIKDVIQNEFKNSGLEIHFVEQTERLGTGHAVSMARNHIVESKNVLVLCGDTPLISCDTIQNAVQLHQVNHKDATLLVATLNNPDGYGRIVRTTDKTIKIVEDKDCNTEEKYIKQINTGIYIFDSKSLINYLSQIDNNNEQNEYYLTDTIKFINNVQTFGIGDPNEILGINDRYQLFEVASKFNEKLVKIHMRNGVTFINPNNVYLDHDIQIGMDTVIYPGCHIKNGSSIGCNCTIGPNTTIDGCNIGDNCEIEYSVLRKSNIDNNVKIGPFAHIRPDCNINKGVKIGDFVEVKNSNIGINTKIPHLSYVGDANVGESVNFGCGSIVVNYDGKFKHRSTINDGAFIGCNSNIVSPVELGQKSFIAAGSTITQNVPDKALAIARERQVNKEKWVE